jgi:hypothetical protein
MSFFLLYKFSFSLSPPFPLSCFPQSTTLRLPIQPAILISFGHLENVLAQSPARIFFEILPVKIDAKSQLATEGRSFLRQGSEENLSG